MLVACDVTYNESKVASCQSAMNLQVLIYSDIGTSNVDTFINALKFSFESLKEEGKIVDFRVTSVVADEVNSGHCFKNANMFIMPGGRDLPYVEKLRGKGIENIKNFVENGGCYFGVCAGGYFASSYCEFEKGSNIEVCGKRELQLYPGKATGSVYQGFEYGTEAGAKIIGIILENSVSSTSTGRVFKCYHNGGCEFLRDQDNKSPTVQNIARYEDYPDKVSIVFGKYGRGKFLLSGVHPEMNFKFLTTKSKFSEEQLKSLDAISSNQQELFENLLSLIL